MISYIRVKPSRTLIIGNLRSFRHAFVPSLSPADGANPPYRIVPEILVFYCAPCQHAETKVEERVAPEAEERAALTHLGRLNRFGDHSQFLNVIWSAPWLPGDTSRQQLQPL
jgi:hypothetical protein